MAEYISREAAVMRIREWFWSAPGVHPKLDRDTAEELLFSIPAADVVPVVRCKDCKYRHDDDFCGGRGWPAQLVPDDGYCDNGARKDGDVWKIS